MMQPIAVERCAWHEGEEAAQKLATGHDMPRVIRHFMTRQLQAFFPQLPFVLVGSADEDGLPAATLLAGRPGFVHPLDDETLRVEAMPFEGEPLAQALAIGASLGLLGIELSTRRRNRINGWICELSESGFTLHVEQAFGNCAKYIHRRDVSAEPPRAPAAIEPMEVLSDEALALIGRADTFFVASCALQSSIITPTGVDISHRGRRPGFVGLDQRGRLVVPDFHGNAYFNTLGNFVVHPHAGLMFSDAASGDLLQISGDVEIEWGGPDIEAYAGAERLWRLTPRKCRWLRGAWPYLRAQPQIALETIPTGTFEEAFRRFA